MTKTLALSERQGVNFQKYSSLMTESKLSNNKKKNSTKIMQDDIVGTINLERAIVNSKRDEDGAKVE